MSIANLEFEFRGKDILPNSDTSELGYKEEHITLKLEINNDNIKDTKTGESYLIDSNVEKELKKKHLHMSLPKKVLIDDQVNDKVNEDVSGSDMFLEDFTDTDDILGELSKIPEGIDTSLLDKDDHLLLCDCIMGDCLPGKTKCNKCLEGWHGKRCDIHDSQLKEKEKTKPKKIKE